LTTHYYAKIIKLETALPFQAALPRSGDSMVRRSHGSGIKNSAAFIEMPGLDSQAVRPRAPPSSINLAVPE